MSNTLDFDLKERIRSAVDIVDVIGGQMELRRQGRNYVALCPWHADRRPSLMINPVRQTWRCWVCDIGGDIFNFVMKRDGVSFPEALQILGEQAGIPVDQLRSSKPTTPGSKDDKATLLAAMRWACDQFHNHLLTGEGADVARQYAASRELNSDLIEKFKIGYAPESWDWLLSRALQAGFSGEVLHACGLVTPRKSGSGYYDMFRNRLMFPIWDLQGRPISAGGRVLPGSEGQGGKYINGPETRLFSKSRQLYGLNFARDTIVRTRVALVMEGYTDVIAAARAGIDNAVAVLGTALGEAHIQLLKRFADSVVLVLDGDQAGQRRADEVLELFVKADVDLRVLTLPDGLDPADYLNQHGTTALQDLIAAAPDAIDYKLHRLTEGVDLTHDTHRVSKAIEQMLATLAQSPVSTGDIKLQQTLVRLGKTFTLPIEHLQRRLEELKQRRHKPSPTRAQKVTSDSTSTAPPDDLFDRSDRQEDSQNDRNRTTVSTPNFEPILGLDRELFEALIETPDFVSQAIEAVEESWLKTESARHLMRAYQALELAGMSLDISDLLLAVEDEFLKNQLVILEHRVSLKSESATLPPSQRFVSILQRYRDIQTQMETQQRIAQLDSPQIPDDEQLDMLEELFAAQRLKQGHVRFDAT